MISKPQHNDINVPLTKEEKAEKFAKKNYHSIEAKKSEVIEIFLAGYTARDKEDGAIDVKALATEIGKDMYIEELWFDESCIATINQIENAINRYLNLQKPQNL